MSCGNPAIEQDALMPRRKIGKHAKICVKCKEPSGRVFIRHAVYCRECFFSHVVQKSRRCLDPYINPIPDKSRRTILKASGNLVIGYSGGLGSTVLLDFIHKWYFQSRDTEKGGKDHPRNASVWKKAYICYVDWSNAFQGMTSMTANVRNVTDRFEGFEFVPVRIESAFDPEWWKSVGADSMTIQDELGIDLDLHLSPKSPSTNTIVSLQTYLNALPTPTAVLTSLQILTRLLLLHTSQSRHASHLVLGTSLTSLAVSLISSIAQGGGYVTRQEAQEEWKNRSDSKEIRVIRPLRDVGMKECAMWAWWCGLNVAGKQKIPVNRGIGVLTKNFIVGLEKDYPSTISAIARTCGKLAPKGGEDGLCAICQKPIQAGVQQWKESISIRSFAPPGDQDQVDSSAETIEPDDAGPGNTRIDLTPYLCYACHTTFTSKTSKTVTRNETGAEPALIPLPVWTQDNLRNTLQIRFGTGGQAHDRLTHSNQEVRAQKMLGEDEMKAKIEDFLL